MAHECVTSVVCFNRWILEEEGGHERLASTGSFLLSLSSCGISSGVSQELVKPNYPATTANYSPFWSMTQTAVIHHISPSKMVAGK